MDFFQDKKAGPSRPDEASIRGRLNAVLRAKYCPCWSGFQARYSWALHGALLLPVFAVVLAAGFAHGFWGELPRLRYESLRQSYPFITEGFRLVTDYTMPALYGAYALILVQAFRNNDVRKISFIVRWLAGFLLLAVFATQILKTGFGLPRPGHALPPQPFSFVHAYASFPSGHTTTVIAAALPLAFFFRQKSAYIAAALIMALVAYSRLWLGMHHPVDLVAGCVLGSAAARFVGSEWRSVVPRKSFE